MLLTPSQPKKRKATQCGVCGGVGHNKATCPKASAANAKAPKLKKSELGNPGASTGAPLVPLVNADSDAEGDGTELTYDNLREGALDVPDCSRTVQVEEDSESEPEDIKRVYEPVSLPVQAFPDDEVTYLRTKTMVSAAENTNPVFKALLQKKQGHQVANPMGKKPFDLFCLLWTVVIMTTFVFATNAYATTTKDKEWKRPVTVIELRCIV